MGLDTVELVIAVEKHFQVDIPDNLAANAVTVGLLAELVCALRSEEKRPLHYDEVLSQLKLIIANMFSIPRDKILPETNFVRDLGLD